MVSHDIASLKRTTNRVAYVGEGRILSIEPIEQLMKNPHPFDRRVFSQATEPVWYNNELYKGVILGIKKQLHSGWTRGLDSLDLLAFCWFVALSRFDRKEYDHYIVYMDEPVSGLSDESAVKYNVYVCGYVSDIDLSPNNPQRVRLLLKIEQGMPITVDTRANTDFSRYYGYNLPRFDSHIIFSWTSPKTPEEPYPVIPYRPFFLLYAWEKCKSLKWAIQRSLYQREHRQY